MNDFIETYVAQFREKGLADEQIVELLVEFLDFIGVDCGDSNREFFENALNTIPAKRSHDKRDRVSARKP